MGEARWQGTCWLNNEQLTYDRDVAPRWWIHPIHGRPWGALYMEGGVHERGATEMACIAVPYLPPS